MSKAGLPREVVLVRHSDFGGRGGERELKGNENSYKGGVLYE